MLGYVPSQPRGRLPAPDHAGHGQPQPAPVGPPGARLVRADPGDLPPPAAPSSGETRDEFIELLDLGELVDKPVRNLSLGERMKMEFAGALLHRPQVLFLDEPTLGLDVTMQKRIRTFVAEYNRRYGATVLLTSHYMADVQALCRRVIVIHHGRILFDGDLAALANRFDPTKTIGVTLADGTADLSAYGEVLATEDGRVVLRVPRARRAEVTTRLLRDLPVADLTIEDPPIEDVIERVFADARDERATRPRAGRRGDA